MTLHDIESTHNITYPNLYKELSENGMLSWGETDPDWYTKTYPILSKNPPLLLYGCDFELLEFEQIDEETDAFKEPYRQINSKFNFIPFAQNGGGDLYCFQFDKKVNEDIPIVRIWHDANEANVLAKNLQDFIFRSMTESLVEYRKDYSLLDNGNLCENLDNYKRTHLQYLSTTQQEVMTEIFGKIINEKPSGSDLLSETEKKTIIKKMTQMIMFADLDRSFEYQLT